MKRVGTVYLAKPRHRPDKAEAQRLRCRKEDASVHEGPTIIREKYELARQQRLQWTQYEKYAFIHKHRDEMSHTVHRVLSGVEATRKWKHYTFDTWLKDENRLQKCGRKPQGFRKFKKELQQLDNTKWNPRFTKTARSQMAWKYGSHLNRQLIEKLLACPVRPCPAKVKRLVRKQRTKQCKK